ncbi:MAG: phenylalanine--tRNA ligase subunit alpha [bacterium]
MNAALESLLQELDDLQHRFEAQIQTLKTAQDLEVVRVQFLARKGEIQAYFKKLGELEPGQRPSFGQRLNDLRRLMETALAAKSESLGGAAARAPKLDLTLPGIPRRLGVRHPMLQVLDQIKKIFMGMGFSVASGPLIETDFYNFEALNIPADHPSRDLQDTLYIAHPAGPKGETYLLRTHTSPVQVHALETQPLPIRLIAPGRVFRKDAPDATHSPVFHQVEGLWVDEGVSMADLKGMLFAFAHKLLGRDLKLRFRPSYFPFTEPSAELDVWFPSKNRWMELLGCGMVHPAVLERLGIDSGRYTGFAWGMGIERLAMRRYGIDDIRMFYDNDVRFLRQFS